MTLRIPALLVVLLSLASSGCRPQCEDALLESDIRGSCEFSGGTSAQCKCSWDYLAWRHTCEQLATGDPAVNVQDAINACP